MWAFVWIFLLCVCLWLGDLPWQCADFRHSASCPAAPSRLWWDYGTPSRCLWPTMTPSPLATPYWKSGRSRYDCNHLDGRASPRWPWTPSRWLASRTARRITTSAHVFAWIYRQINDDLTFQIGLPRRGVREQTGGQKLAHSMMEAFKKPSTACAVTDASTRAARPTSSLKRRAHPTTAERHGGVGNGSRALYVFVP